LAKENKWHVDFTGPHMASMYAIETYYVNLVSPFQRVEVAKSSLFGKCLILDGKIQSSEFDEYIYHEALVHPAMLAHPRPRTVMVIGGGEGATLREVFKHPSVGKVVMVDIDKDVVDLCKEYLPEWHQGSFEDARLELIHADARQYLEDNEVAFDVMIIDLPEPVEEGPSRRLFTRQFYQIVKKRLNENGIMVLQSGDFSLTFMEAHSAIYKTVASVMPAAYSYHVFIPSFNTDWSFVITAREGDPFKELDSRELDRRIAERNLQLKSYDGVTHQGMFSIPKNIRAERDSGTMIIDDDNLLTID